jgi:tetratricopeptide (TPR) repeat protein
MWDRDTLRDEATKKPDAFDLAAGQLPRHSSAWYERRLTVTEDWPDSLPLSDDRASALVYLERYDEAGAVLTHALARDPTRYETLSNLGVLRKKEGRLEEAEAHLKAALAQRPEGHMGVGDWYPRGVRWRMEERPEETFLGTRYTWEHEGGKVDRGRLEALLRFDHDFSDGLFVFGDVLRSSEDSQLASVAMVRAQMLGHPRLDMIVHRFETMADRMAGSMKKLEAKAMQAIAHASAWRHAFQAQEAAMLQAGLEPSFVEVESALLAARVERHRPAARSGCL